MASPAKPRLLPLVMAGYKDKEGWHGWSLLRLSSSPHMIFLLFLVLAVCLPPCSPVTNTTRGNVTPGADNNGGTGVNKLLPNEEKSEAPTMGAEIDDVTQAEGLDDVAPPVNSGTDSSEGVLDGGQTVKPLPPSSTPGIQPTTMKPAARKNDTSLHTSKVIIDTKQGRMGGIAVNVDNEVTTRFLGVPYAAAPIGELRFKPPQKHTWKQEKGWSFRSIWNATKVKPACPRDLSAWRYPFSLDNLYGDMVSNVETSEDCLYLNIFVPRNLSSLEHINTLALPVMIYFHDGHLRTEHSMLRNAWRFARDGQVIVATVGFRVDVLGYFSLLEADAMGNFGLMDQSLALHWIWDNIREFGGNPEKITIFGSGPGGIDVGYHVLSPQSRGMFVRAISQSGSLVSNCCRHKNPVAAATALARNLNCPRSPHSSMMACLRKASLGHLMTAAQKTAKDYGRWWPVIDGKFIPDEPLKLLQAGKFNPVDYIIGGNSHDGFETIRNMHIDLDLDVSNDGLEDIIRNFVQKNFHANHEQVTRALLTEYHFCALNVTELGQSLVDFLTDMDYLAPAELAARYLSRNINRRIFLYEFAHRPSYASDRARPPFITAHHLDDLEYVTGDVRYVIKSVTPAERSLSEALMSAWTNFARTGDPNPISGGHGLRWDRFTEAGRHYALFTTGLNASNLRTNLRPRQMALWNDYLRHLGTIPTTCSNARDHCERGMRPVVEYHSKVSIAMWILVALVLILVAAVVFLAAKLWLPPEYWQRCKVRRPAKGSHEAETKKLHPLPYCDEPT